MSTSAQKALRLRIREGRGWYINRIREAFLELEEGKAVDVIFEHGQFWVCQADGSQYAVEEGTGPGTFNGFTFEQVREAEEE